MRASKSLIVAALVAGSLLAGSAALQAQNSTNPPPAGARGMRGAPNIDQIATALKLDDATKAKVKTILDDQQKKIDEMRADNALATADRRARMQAIRDETFTKMKTVLTPDQFDQWQKMSQPRLRRAPLAGGNPPSPAAPPAPPQR